MRRALFLALIVASPALAGCLGGKALPALDSSIELYAQNRSREFSWPPLQVLDPSGNASTADTSTWPRLVDQLLPFEGSGPTLAIHPKGALFVTIYDRLLRSTDHGLNWTVVHRFESPNAPVSSDFFETSGSNVVIDPANGRLFLQHVNGQGCDALSWSDDLGQTWHQPRERTWPLTCAEPQNEVGFRGAPRLFLGPRGPQNRLASPSAYPSVLHRCYVSTLTGPEETLQCWVSYDGGERFVQVAPIPPEVGCKSLGIGRAGVFKDGTVAIPLFGRLRAGANGVCPLRVAVSRDNGLTWSMRTLGGPGSPNSEGMPQAVVGTDGVAYVAYRMGTTDGMSRAKPASRVQLVASTDQFQTWKGPWSVSPPDLTLTHQVSVVAGSAGRVAVAYLASRTPQDPAKFSIDAGTLWHVFVTTTHTALTDSPVFVTQQVSPHEDPVQQGDVDPAPPTPLGAQGDGNLANTVNLARDEEGRVHLVFTDGCVRRNDCIRDRSSAFQARDRNAAIAIVDEGLSLLEERGMLPRLGLARPDSWKNGEAQGP